MSFFEKKYEIKGWYGSINLTAKQLYNRILEDSKSDYNWIAPAHELVRVCQKSSFPYNYSVSIKIAILNCFSNIEHRANCGGDRYLTASEDDEAVAYCYNSLYGVNTEESISARNRYLAEMIASASDIRFFDPHYHRGPTFRKLRETWEKSKFEEYKSHEKIDFKQLVNELHNNFIEIIKSSEANGDFDEDEKAATERMKNITKIIFDSM